MVLLVLLWVINDSLKLFNYGEIYPYRDDLKFGCKIQLNHNHNDMKGTHSFVSFDVQYIYHCFNQ